MLRTTNYTFTAATQSALTSPAGGSVLAGPTVTFKWTTATGATGYIFRLGSTAGGNDLAASGVTTATSVSVGNLPTNGETVYGQLVTIYGSLQRTTNYTFTAATQSALTSPAGGSVLAGPTVTFKWTAASGATGYIFRLGTTSGGNDLVASGQVTATSIAAGNLPTNGATLYGQLVTVYGSLLRTTNYTFTAATQSALTSPAGGSVLAGPTVTFKWTAASGATGYIFRLGTTAGGNNLAASGVTTATSVSVGNLPTNGETVYGQLVTIYGSVQETTNYTFTAGTQSALTSPAGGSVLVGPKVTFNWTAASGATGYIFRLGTTSGGNDLVASGQITATSITAGNLPTNGATLYGQLVTVYGSVLRTTNYTFTAATQSALTSPAGGSVLAGPTVTFNWTIAGGATGYIFRLGSTAGANDLAASGLTTATSVTAGNLPTNGETVYGQLVTVYGSVQVTTNYTFTAATQSALTSPTGGSVLSGATVTFSWSAASGATGYIFRLGTTAGGNNLVATGQTTATSVTAGNLPTNGETLYGQLVTIYGSAEVTTNYTFTAATQ